MSKPGIIVYDTDAVYNAEDLSDVTITSVADNELLTYDSSSSEWINQTPDEVNVVDKSTAQTLTNKTIDADSNTISNIAIGAECTGASTDLTDTADLTYNADTDISGNGWVLDEDAMGSNDDTKVPTQQSVKAYVDAHAADTTTHGTTGDIVGTSDTQALTNKTFGDETNYASFAADGELTLAGTARVIREVELQASNIAAGASGVTLNTDYLPYVGYDFGIGDNMYCQFEVPYNWDSSTDLTVYLYWAINEARTGSNEEVQWAIDWKACPVDTSEAIDTPTHTGSIDFGDQLIPTVAKYLAKSTAGTIAAASLSAGDIIGLDVNRVALDDGNSPTDEPILYRVEIEYTSNVLGEAT